MLNLLIIILRHKPITVIDRRQRQLSLHTSYKQLIIVICILQEHLIRYWLLVLGEHQHLVAITVVVVVIIVSAAVLERPEAWLLHVVIVL